MRLDKFLSNQGCGSRKEVKIAIKKGLVKVNQITIKKVDFKVDENTDLISYNNQVIQYRKYVYIMLHKPKGYISATKDSNASTVLDLIQGYEHFNLAPVGRLDKDTEGLLLLSNDGELAHRLLSPANRIPKTYYVEIDSLLCVADMVKIQEGIVIDTGYKCLPSLLEQMGDYSYLMTIYEGKFHQVKKMFKAVNHKVVYLKRMSMHTLVLDETLHLGEYRELTKQEINSLK